MANRPSLRSKARSRWHLAGAPQRPSFLSNNGAPTVAAISAPTRHTRSKTGRYQHPSVLVDPDPSDGDGLRVRLLYARRRRLAAWIFAVMLFAYTAGVVFSAGRRRAAAGRSTGWVSRRSSVPMEGKEIRIGSAASAMGHDDDRHLERVGRLDARFADPAERYAAKCSTCRSTAGSAVSAWDG